MIMSGKRIILLAAVLLMAVQTLGAQGRSSSGKGFDSDAALIDAVQLLEGGRLKEASGKFAVLTLQDPTQDAAWYYLGMCHLYQKNIRAAQKAFLKASELDPGNFWYRDRLAIAYSMGGEEELTLATYEQMLKDFPKKTEVYYNLANLYIRQGKLDKALEAMNQIETVFGRSDQVTLAKYDILLRQNKPGEAMKVLQDYNAEETSERVLAILGDHEMAEYRDSSALAYYSEALALDPDYPPAVLGKAEVYRSRRNYPAYFDTLTEFFGNENATAADKSHYLSALLQHADGRFIQNFRPRLDSLIDLGLSHHPADSSLLSTAGMYYFGTDRPERAIAVFRSARDAHPESVSAAVTYIQVLGTRNDWEGVIAESEEAMKRFPEETAFLELQNAGYYNTKQFRKVIDNCERIIARFPDDTSRTLPSLCTIGDMCNYLKDVRGCYKAYERALKINPDYSPVLNNYAYYLAESGRQLKKALAMSRKTIEKEPDNPTLLDTYGWILHLMGKDAEAKPYFKHAMLYGGKESAVILDHYAEVLDALGEYDLAKMYRLQAKEKKKEE